MSAQRIEEAGGGTPRVGSGVGRLAFLAEAGLQVSELPVKLVAQQRERTVHGRHGAALLVFRRTREDARSSRAAWSTSSSS